MEIRIDKQTKKIKLGVDTGSAKISFVTFYNDLLILKIGGFSQYVHRGIGVNYSPAVYSTFKVNKIINYEDFISIQVDSFIASDTSVKTGLEDFIDNINNQYEIKKYDPLARYSEKDKKELQEIFKRNEELMKNFETALEKHRSEVNEQ